jgi:hypothetical protein
LKKEQLSFISHYALKGGTWLLLLLLLLLLQSLDDVDDY